ncbi:Branched-chain-amino-acid aminotransferase [bacterium HR35]|nr:Branched-chain-amino-acid aminotransferase [bacterium HR35]
MKLKIWFNGKIVNWDQAKVHVLTHTLHYGGGVFEGIRSYETIDNRTAVFRLDDHLKRLFKSANSIYLKIPYSLDEIKKGVLNLLKVNNLKDAYIRPIAFWGEGKINLDPRNNPVNLAIIAFPFGAYLGEKPVKVLVSKYIRLHPQSVVSSAKVCGYYINSILATIEAHQKGYDEALLLDYRGMIAEGAGENIFIVKDKKLLTPKLGNILPGITRDTIIKIAKDYGIKVIEKDLNLKEVFNADEVFFTGTAAEVVAIGKINNKLINKGKEGEITKLLRETYKKIVRGEIRKYSKWLSYVN